MGSVKYKKACKPTPDEPSNYVDRGVWMEAKLKTHEQKQCHTCGFWHIWVLKKRRKV